MRHALVLVVVPVIIVFALATSVSTKPTPKPHPTTAASMALIHYANGVAAPARLFYTSSGESGAVARELGGTQIPASQNETLTYQPNAKNYSFGWVTPSGQPGAVGWPAAKYLVTLDVTRANPSLQLDEVKIYRTDASGGPNYHGLAVVADKTGLAQPLRGGRLTFDLEGAAQRANASDRLAVKFYVRNTSSRPQRFSYGVDGSHASGVATQPE